MKLKQIKEEKMFKPKSNNQKPLRLRQIKSQRDEMPAIQPKAEYPQPVMIRTNDMK